VPQIRLQPLFSNILYNHEYPIMNPVTGTCGSMECELLTMSLNKPNANK
jgi:hypothetical protein